MQKIKIYLLQILVILSVISFVPGCATIELGAKQNNNTTVLPIKSFTRIEWTLGGELRGLGSGFVIKETLEGSLVLTAEHVCDPNPQMVLESILEGKEMVISARSFDGVVKEAVILKIDKKQDLCLLKVVGLHKPAVEISDEIPKIGEKIYVIGAPQGFTSPEDGMVPIIPGIFNGYMTLNEDEAKDRFQIYTARISPGNSGGMVVNENGEVVGNTNFGWRMRFGFSDICGGSRLDSIKSFVSDHI